MSSEWRGLRRQRVCSLDIHGADDDKGEVTGCGSALSLHDAPELRLARHDDVLEPLSLAWLGSGADTALSSGREGVGLLGGERPLEALDDEVAEDRKELLVVSTIAQREEAGAP